jgi:hypothetical protein
LEANLLLLDLLLAKEPASGKVSLTVVILERNTTEPQNLDYEAVHASYQSVDSAGRKPTNGMCKVF